MPSSLSIVSVSPRTWYKTGQNLLARCGKQVKGVFASNESNTLGIRLGLNDANLLHKVKFVGFDATPGLVDALKADELQGLVAQNRFHMGEMDVKTLVAVIKGQKVDKNVDTGVAVITKDNVNAPENQSFLNPPISQYVK